MKIKNLLAGVAATAALALGSQVAQAALICDLCKDGDDAGTYLGTYSPPAFDVGTFGNGIGQDVGPNTAFTDYWVFDLEPGGSGSISANFTSFAAISGFHGELYTAGDGTSCGSGAGDDCSAIVLGALLESEAAAGLDWQILADNLPAGRYIIVVTGTTNGPGNSAYTGQLAFVPEPGTLALLGFGLLGMGLTARRRRA